MAEKKKFSWSKAVLVMSLGFNLAVVGVVAGAWVNGPDRGERGKPRPAWNNGPFGRALSDEDRKALAQEFRNEQGAGKRLRSHRADMRANGVAIADALRADPFDPAALEILFGQMKQLGNRQNDVGSEALFERLVSMSTEDRLGFADRFENAIKRHKGKRH